MSPFEQLVADLKLNQEKSPFAKAQGLDGWVAHFVSEAKEVFEEIDKDNHKQDMRKITEELGDAIWTWIALAVEVEKIADRNAYKGMSIQDVIARARDKLHARKPWIFDPNYTGSFPQTAQEEHEMYVKLKNALKR